MSTAPQPLNDLAEAVRADDTLLAEHLRDASAGPGLGALVAAGARAEGAEADYAFVVEAIREGYLLHYGEPRILAGIESDLALLAGDHLYALGLERLAGLGDLEAVRELADLISLCAQLHAAGPGEDRTPAALWLAATTAVAAGASPRYEAAKASLRRGAHPVDELAAAALETAAGAGIGAALAHAADSIDFALPDPPTRG